MNKLAVGSLALSFLAFIVPLGIASVVMGHMSRSQIARSNSRQTGAWYAFAGLVISYMQFAVVVLVCIGLVGVWGKLSQEMNRDPDLRAAVVARIKYGDPNHPSAAAIAQHRVELIDALRLIREKQEVYRGSHPRGYACDLNDLTVGDEELQFHVIHSYHKVEVLCQGATPADVYWSRYVVTAVPQSDSNPADSPMYCLDQTGIVRKYTNDQARDVTTKIFFDHQTCSQDGEVVQ